MTRSEIAGSRAVVVGGAGFVGSNLVRTLLDDGASSVLIIDNLLSANRTDVLDRDGVTFVEGSIADQDIVTRIADEVDFVFHLATYHGNQSSMHDPIADHRNNLLTTLVLYNHLASFENLSRVVYASAGCTMAEKIYGEARPTREDDPVSLRLDSPYQISKIVGEMYGNYFMARNGLPVVHARFQNVYGPGEILGAGQWRGTPATVWRNVTPTFVYRALKGMPLILENEGESSRDFIYVGDIVRGLIACALRGTEGDAYNLASGVETTIRELAETINRYVDPPAPVELAPRRPWDHSGNRLGSTEKAAAGLGFEASVALDEGIRQTVEWTRANMPMIDASIDRHRARLEAA
ncbi:MAG TPA: NAD-dependent epimerase/dehydratase family protein [Candidatus Limnocylindria bacterium]|nr:NAD-dependent epimerase/dehydratase family protein [Candidatus Limnocylindria bacterium]